MICKNIINTLTTKPLKADNIEGIQIRYIDAPIAQIFDIPLIRYASLVDKNDYSWEIGNFTST